MKLSYTTIFLAVGAGLTYAAPNQERKLKDLFSAAGFKAVDALQGYADSAGVGINVQEKANAMMDTGKNFMDSKTPELQKWMEDNGYAAQAKAIAAEATKMRNKNRNNSPAKILDNLTRKVNGMAKASIENKSVKRDLIKFTKALNVIAKKSVSESDYANMKARNMWKDAASQMEAQLNVQIKNAQDKVDNA